MNEGIRSLSYDAELDVYTLTQRQPVYLETPEDFEAWTRDLEALLTPLRERRADLLIEIHNFRLRPSLSGQYGQVARRVTRGLGIVLRYGEIDGWTSTAVQLQSMIQGYEANLYPDRDAAIEALKALRAERVRRSQSGSSANQSSS